MTGEALEGLKIADFSWVLAGPLVTKHMADYGATVVRIESRERLDIMRATLPYKNGEPGIDRAGYYAFYNTNKYDIALDLSNEAGKKIARRLVEWADIMVENFAPGTIEKLGFGYEDLKAVKPDIIMLRLSNQGQTGPYSRYACLGNQLNALSGFAHFTGWPDRSPLSLPLAYSDYFSPWLAVSALLAAVDYRRRTGEGRMIDISQFEASLQFMGPYIMEYAANGNQGQRAGNSHRSAAPHGAYPCLGDNRWCAIAVTTDEQWRAFRRALGEPDWAKKPQYGTISGRKENERELDALVGEWTSRRTAEEAMETLQRHGVPAGVVKNARDIYEDPQLGERQHLWKLDHREMGPFSHLGQPARLSVTPACPKMPAPCLGEHTEYVCTGILGMPDDDFIRLGAAGAFGRV